MGLVDVFGEVAFGGVGVRAEGTLMGFLGEEKKKN